MLSGLTTLDDLQVSRIGGTDEASYNKLMNASTELMAKAQTMQQAGALEAKKAENKIMYLQGMQGLQDLANGSVNRAAAVWSEYSGMDIRINPRSDGKYDITLNGKPYRLDFSTLVTHYSLRLTKVIEKHNKKLLLRER